MVSQILHLILRIAFHGLGFLARFLQKSIYLHIYRSFRSMHALAQFLLHTLLLSPFGKAWPRVFLRVSL
jgi:hypothetical protein